MSLMVVMSQSRLRFDIRKAAVRPEMPESRLWPVRTVGHEQPLVTGRFPAARFCRELYANRAHQDRVRVIPRVGKLAMFVAAAVAEVSRVGT
jgi:hypothetical protein